MNTKNRNKLSTMKGLMITSQLLLTFFLGYWLFTQYDEQKQLLTTEMERGLRLAENEVIDSLLATRYIDPFLSDTGNFTLVMFDSMDIAPGDYPMEFGINTDSVQHVTMQISADYIDEDKDSNIAETIKMIESTGRLPDEKIRSTITVQAKQDSGNHILMQGVKMLINTVGKFDIEKGNVYTYFTEDIDSVMLQRIFNKFVNTNFNGLTTDWKIEDRNLSNGKKINGIFIRSNLYEDSLGMKIGHYNLYIIKTIFPQIIFATILLLITSVAFLMAYRNHRNQQKLILLKNDFISNITHELKTPVSTVKVALEALLDFNLRENPDRTRKYLEMARNQNNRLDIIVNQVLNSSAFENGGDFLVKSKINLVVLIKEVLSGMRYRFTELQASVGFSETSDDIIIEADKFHLQGVITNLIDNSLKYNNNIPEINIGLTKSENSIIITVEDNGIGIPTEYTGKVFEKFFRVPTGNEHNIKGFGLGLNYAALIVSYHKGSIKVENGDRQGCVFTIKLPVS